MATKIADEIERLSAALTAAHAERDAAERERNQARARAVDAEARLAAASVHEAAALRERDEARAALARYQAEHERRRP